MGMIAALYVDLRGPYPTIDAVDCWDANRDARWYAGPHSVVAHPPCNRWGTLAPVNEKRWGTKIGHDGGCFANALAAVRRYGGVLEHPAKTMAWKYFGLTKPTGLGWFKAGPREWVAEVWQSAYGHKATKRTWLLYVGSNQPLPFRQERQRGTHQIGGGVRTGNRTLPRLGKGAHLSPPEFAAYLVNLARHSMICACGKKKMDGIRCKLGATHQPKPALPWEIPSCPTPTEPPAPWSKSPKPPWELSGATETAEK